MLPPPADRSATPDPLDEALATLDARAKALSDAANELFKAVARVVADAVRVEAAAIVEAQADHSLELGGKGLKQLRAEVDGWCDQAGAATRRRLIAPDGSPPIWPQAWTFPTPPVKILDADRVPFTSAGQPLPPRVDNAIRSLIADGVAALVAAGYDLSHDPGWETAADGRVVRYLGAYRPSPVLLSAARAYASRRGGYISAVDRVLWLRAVAAAAEAEAAANREQEAKRSKAAQQWAEAGSRD